MTGQYYQQPYGVAPEADSIKSLVRIAGIFGIIAIIIGVIVTIILFLILWPLALIGVLIILVGFIFFDNCKKINEMVDQGQYQQAKSKTLIWMIIGFIFLNMIPGIILLIAYTKFDNLIRGPMGIGYMPPPPGYGAPPPLQRLCLSCGQQIAANYNNCPHCGRLTSQKSE